MHNIKELQLEYNKVFDDSTLLRDAIAAAEKQDDGQRYQFNAFGEIEYWHRFYELSQFEDCKEYLESWLSDRTGFFYIDWQNDCLLIPQGGCFVINDDGDVYDSDSHKVIVDASDYTVDGEADIAKRNALIEAYMEKTGYYPGVFKADYYGNVFPVNTQAKED